MLKRSFGAIKPISEQRYAPDEELARIIEKMMKIDLKARYQRMEDVVTELERYQNSVHEAATEGVAAARRRRRRRSKHPRSKRRRSSFRRSTRRRAPEPADPSSDQASGEELQPFEVQTVKHARQKSVLCVESQAEIQDALRKSLSRMGYRVLLVSDAETAAERFREAGVDAVVFDADGQGAESIDAFVDMHETAHEDGQQFARSFC